MLSLQEWCNIIVLVSAVLIAVKNIYGFFKKPVNTLQDRANTKEEKHIEQVINKKIPEILKEHSINVREERVKEDEKMAQLIQKSIISAFDDKFEELKEISLDQGVEIKRIQSSIDLLNTSQLDLMRYNMNRLYYKYRPYKKILDCDKKAFIKLYNDYKPMGGNNWIDALYTEVTGWEIVENESELET